MTEKPKRPGFGDGNKQGERKVSVPTPLKPRARELLMRASADQFRSLSGQAEKYVIDGLMRDGYIVASEKDSI